MTHSPSKARPSLGVVLAFIATATVLHSDTHSKIRFRNTMCRNVFSKFCSKDTAGAALKGRNWRIFRNYITARKFHT